MGKLSTLIVGGVIGAAAALLLSPRNGEENRALLKEKLGDEYIIPAPVQEKANQFVQQAAVTSTKVINTVVDSAQDAYKNVSARTQNITPASPELFSDKNDELREKIDAARARIATQVAKNAEAVHDAAIDKAPAVVDAANNAADAAKGAAATVADAAKTAATTAADTAKSVAGNAAEAAKTAAGTAKDAVTNAASNITNKN